MRFLARSIVCLILITSAAHAEDTDTAEAPRKLVAAKVIQQLAAEAKAALRNKDATFPPRAESDFAETAGGTLGSEDVVKSMQRRLDRVPLVDAYIKWQLLSFEPKLKELGAADIIKVFDALPELQPRDQVSRSDQRIVQTYGNKKDIPAEASRRLARIAENFEAEQKKIDAHNQPNLELRKALMSQLPDHPGVELLALAREAEQRMRSFDKSWKTTIDKIEELAEKIKDDRDYSAGLRKAIRQKVNVLHTLQGERITTFSVKTDGEVQVRFQKVQANQKQLDRIYAYLDGRAPIQ